jgi:hypothetical protein
MQALSTFVSQSRRRAYSTALLVALGAMALGCSSSSNSASAAGLWAGTTEADGVPSIPVHLGLQEDSSGVSGSLLVLFPGASDYYEVDSLTGARTGANLHLTGTTGVTIDVTIAGGSMTGTLTFPSLPGASSPTVGRLALGSP